MTEFAPELIDTLRRARKVVVFTGAGISAPSGVPTFRDAQSGIWAKFRPEDLATPDAFRHDPERVWAWYRWRIELVAQAQPNAGHRALVKMEQFIPELTIITQNVDNLHQRAGSQHVIELHGNLFRARCLKSGHRVSIRELSDEPVPRCPECGSLMRPDVVWFGESLPEDAWSTAVKLTRRCDLFFSIGTSTVVYPAAMLPFEAIRAGAGIVEINPQATPLSNDADWVIRESADVALDRLVQLTWPDDNDL